MGQVNFKILAEEIGVKESQVTGAVALIDEGNTIPFIARYRKEATGGMDDEALRKLEERLKYMRCLEERKEEVLRLIDEQGKLTEELAASINEATILQRVEDLYKPYKQKRATRASKAREKGLEPLMLDILHCRQPQMSLEELGAGYIDPEKEVETVEDALTGAMDIIAELISDDAAMIEVARSLSWEKGLITSEAVDPEEVTVYDKYYQYSEKVAKMPGYRTLAVNRGEKEKKLKVKLELPDEEIIAKICKSTIGKENPYKEFIEGAIVDGYKRLLSPSIEREIRSMLTEKAEEEAIKVFAKNTESLLMTPPVKNKGVLSIDPGYRTGCKVAVLDPSGKLLGYTTVYPTEPKKDIAGTEATFKKIMSKFQIDVIVIGNGTASRETEEVVANFLKKENSQVQYTIVNEAGASVYSASKLATEEYPDLDVTTRGAMSLGRRLQDPLAELVKIDPKHIGVGQYQHDMNQKKLSTTLGNVVEDCVNKVGVDLNTASPSLLGYVAGINSSIAKNIVAFREENGPFTERKQLMKVAKLGEKAFKQCAGFLRITDGKEALDQTAVHPESYKEAKALVEKLGISEEQLRSGIGSKIEEKIKEAYNCQSVKSGLKMAAEELGLGVPTLSDIVDELRKPARDPREDAPPVVFRNDVKSLEDLEEGMEMTGTVRNVVDFGAFVDIGVKNDGLVHISQLSHKFVKDPMSVVSVGDTVKVKILSIDKARGKVALTMKL